MEIWWIIVIAIAIVALISLLLAIASTSNDKFLKIYEQMMVTPANSHMTIMEFINQQNFEKFDGKLKLSRTEKEIGDAYNSKHKVLILTDKTLQNDSIASFSIVAHELGHAEQDFSSKKIKRMRITYKIGWLVGKLFLPTLIAFIVLMFFENLRVYGYVLAGVAAAIFLFAVIVKVITISIEKDASKRAIKTLDTFLPNNEMKLAKKLLKAARLTYWTDLVRLLFGWSGLVRRTKMF